MDCSTPGFPVHHQLQSLLKLMSIELVMPSNYLILCRHLLLPSIFPSFKIFYNESVLHIRWPKYWSFRFSISSSNEYSGLIFFRMDWLDLVAVQGTLSSSACSLAAAQPAGAVTLFSLWAGLLGKGSEQEAILRFPELGQSSGHSQRPGWKLSSPSSADLVRPLPTQAPRPSQHAGTWVLPVLFPKAGRGLFCFRESRADLYSPFSWEEFSSQRITFSRKQKQVS